MKGRIPFIVGVLVTLTGIGLSVKCTTQPPRFCEQCVMRRDVVEWRLAGRWNLFETSTYHPTPVSELLARHSACPVHQHQWSAPWCVAEADLETSEAPRVRSVGFLNAPRVVSFLQDLFDYADAESISNWRAVAWKPVFASALESALRFRRFPETGFDRRADFLAWWNESAFPLFNKLNEMTVAD